MVWEEILGVKGPNNNNKKDVAHRKTMPQAAGKNFSAAGREFFFEVYPKKTGSAPPKSESHSSADILSITL